MQIAHLSTAWRALLALGVALAVGSARADEPITVRAGSIVGPLSNPIVWNLVKLKELDRKHGLQLERALYPTIAAFYGGFSRGETDVVMGGPDEADRLLSPVVKLPPGVLSRAVRSGRLDFG